jgi:hypothetical protein
MSHFLKSDLAPVWTGRRFEHIGGQLTSLSVKNSIRALLN